MSPSCTIGDINKVIRSSLPTALNKYDPVPLYKIEHHHENEMNV